MNAGTSIRVSAIVSIYKAAQDIRACLQDLIAQDLFQSGELEVICVDAASPEGEEHLVRDLISQHPHQISWHTLNSRVGLYNAWNFAINRAQGEFITNANTDDRHAANCLTILKVALETNPELGMVYGNQKSSRQSSATFENTGYNDSNVSPRFFAPNLLLAHPCGCQPMFRKSVWHAVGGFDESYEVLGDYDFSLRIASKFPIQRVDDAWGLFRIHDSALSKQNLKNEHQKLRDKYWNIPQLINLYRIEGRTEEEAKLLSDFFVRSLAYLHIWEGDLLCRQHLFWLHKILQYSQRDLFSRDTAAIMSEIAETLEKPNAFDSEKSYNLSDFLIHGTPDNRELLHPIPHTKNHLEPIINIENLSLRSLFKCSLGFSIGQIEGTLSSLDPNRSIYIFGAGQLAHRIIPILESMQINVVGISDKHAAEFKNKPVVSHQTAIQEPNSYFYPGTWDLAGYGSFMQSHGKQAGIDYFIPKLDRPYEE